MNICVYKYIDGSHLSSKKKEDNLIFKEQIIRPLMHMAIFSIENTEINFRSYVKYLPTKTLHYNEKILMNTKLSE